MKNTAAIDGEQILRRNRSLQEKFEQEVNLISDEILKLDQYARKLARERKTAQAKRLLQSIKQKRSLIERKESFITTLVKMEMSLESANDDHQLKGVLGDTNKYLEKHAEVQEEVMEEMSAFKEYQEERKMNDEQLKQMMGDGEEDEEMEDELQRLEREIQMEDSAKLGSQLAMADTKLNIPKATQATTASEQSFQAQRNQSSSGNMRESKIEDLMAALA